MGAVERDVEIEPDPSDENRAAVEAAVRAAAEAREPSRSGWWRAGLRENTGEP